MLAKFSDFAFRSVEMILIVGGIRFLETKANAPVIASTFLTALIAVYVRGKTAAALYPAIERYDLSERARRRLWWVFWAVACATLFGSNWVINAVLPIVVAQQR